ncbi:MAG: urea ABC transporter permease subunit UrtB [Rhodospirillales bacterium 20-64-7]|nr:MAG: urea ABC transporter permease subunit UrtB [Rhodospirillales bacterium 20-64-7]HQT78425.1 urea ABC transporter permease subunit UrtB [Rhodopila sp.]
MIELLNQILNGLSIASILLLVSLGLAIIYGAMGVINLAHGDFLMLGAYAVWFLQSTFGIGLLPCLGLVFVIVGIVGWVVERTLIRHLYGRPLDTLLATWGIGIILQQGIRLSAGAELRYVKMPAYLINPVKLLGTDVSAYRLTIFGVTLALLVATYMLIFRSNFGMRLRAVTQNAEIARCFGINVSQVYALTFAYGAGLAGLAGALVSPLKSVSPDMGTGFVVDAFLVVVMGGVQSLFGTVASAGILGQLSTWFAFVSNDTLARALVFTLVLVMIRFRPQGLFVTQLRRG